VQNTAETDAGAAYVAAPLPEFIWPIDRCMINLPDEFAPGIAKFLVADQPIIRLLQRGRTRDWEWRQPRKHASRLVYNDHDEQYFTLRGFGGYGSMFWAAERRLSRTSKSFELLTLESTPLLFRSVSTAETVVQFADQLGDLHWVGA
jgi:hypothetical protein